MLTRNSLSLAALSAVFAIPALVVTSERGYAQQQPEEIIVSVRRRDENLQEVPLSVTTLGEETIDRYGINTLSDVVKYTPGLAFDEGLGAQDTRVVIRGLSPTRGRSNVALLVDGVDFTGEAVSTAGGGILVNQQLLDVERVEVVKGPQSALYGRSAFAGAIQYISKKPSLEETEGSFKVQYGTDGTGGNQLVNFAGAYGGPVTDSFGLRVNGLIYDDEGFYENSLTGQTVGGKEGYGVALAGLWDAGGIASVTGRVAVSHDEYEPQAQARVAGNTLIDINDSLAVTNGETPSLIRTSNLGGILLGGLYPDCDPGGETGQDGAITSCLGTPKVLVTGRMPDADQLRIWQSDNPRTGANYPGTSVDTVTGTLAITWDVEGGEFASYTGFAKLESDQFFDGQVDVFTPGSYSSLDGSFGFTIAPCAYANCAPTIQEIGFENETRLLSQEFRFSSDLEGPLNYSAGALFWKEDVTQMESGSTIAITGFRSVPSFPPNPPTAPPDVETAVPGNAVVNGDIATSPGGVFQPAKGLVTRDTESFSVYGLVEWEIADAWKATFEGRLVKEDLTVTGPICDLIATPALSGLANQDVTLANGDVVEACNMSFRGTSSVGIASAMGTLPSGTYTKAVFGSQSASFEDTFFAPKATVEFTPNDTQLLYFSVAQGIKPGGISTITAGSFFNPKENTFEKEKLLVYELGSKSTLLDGNLLINGAIFYQDYTDKQVGVSRFDPIIGSDTGSIENAGEAEIKGLEVDAFWQITDRVSVSGGYTYVDSEYTSFVIESASANNVARSLAGGGFGCKTLGPNTSPTDGLSETCIIDLTGNKFEDVPEHSFVGNARYLAPIGGNGNEWYAEGSFIYRDDRFIDEWNIKELDSYWTTDLRLGFLGDGYEFILFVDNAFDDDTVKSAVDYGSIVDTNRQGQFPPAPTDGVVVSLPDPRVIGVRANFTF